MNGEVYKAEEITTKVIVVLKEIPVNQSNHEKMVNDLLYGSDNIVKTLAYENNADKLTIVQEYCEGGDLETYIQKHSRVSLELCRKWSYQLLCGVKNMHMRNVIHCDIKPANLLLKNEELKLCDFGSSINLATAESDSSTGGTPLYMPQEALLTNCFSFNSDIWSAGVVIFEMLTGELPFYAGSVGELIEMQKQGTDLSNFSEELREFFYGIFIIEPEKRLDINSLMNCKFLRKFNCYYANVEGNIIGFYQHYTEKWSWLLQLGIGIFWILNEVEKYGVTRDLDTRQLCFQILRQLHEETLTYEIFTQCQCALLKEAKYVIIHNEKYAMYLRSVLIFLRKRDTFQNFNNIITNKSQH